VHDGGRWLVSFDAGLFVTVGGCRRPMMDGRGHAGGHAVSLNRFVPNPARPGLPDRPEVSAVAALLSSTVTSSV
jgi:hypothetical protein